MKQAVANQLRDLRIEAGLTQEVLAEKIGVSRQSVISIERGRFLPSIETALRLAAALDTTVETLFWLKEVS